MNFGFLSSLLISAYCSLTHRPQKAIWSPRGGLCMNALGWIVERWSFWESPSKLQGCYLQIGVN